MNKAELAAQIAERLSLTKKGGEDFVEAFTAVVTEELAQQGDVTIAGFGTFSSRIRAARMGVNPQKPSERIQVPEVLVPKFKAGKALKDALKAAQRGGASVGTPAVGTPVSASAPATPVSPVATDDDNGQQDNTGSLQSDADDDSDLNE